MTNMFVLSAEFTTKIEIKKHSYKTSLFCLALKFDEGNVIGNDNESASMRIVKRRRCFANQ